MNFNYIESLVTKAKNGDVCAKEIIFQGFRPMILNLSNNINYPTTVNIKNRALNQLRKQILL